SHSYTLSLHDALPIWLITDLRCGDALDLLERKELPNGGWAAEGRFYSLAASDPDSVHGSYERVNWGGGGESRMNEWGTVDALFGIGRAHLLNPITDPT